jgi:uncharacterized protein YeaO (DUF488 family)
MDELLNKLLESEILTEATRTELKEAFEKHLADLREDIEVKVRVELIDKYNADFEKLVEAVDTKNTDNWARELSELKEDIEKFRDLEVEYAEKLVESRHEMAENVKADMAQLIETLDTFCEGRFVAEFTELREDIDMVKKHNTGMRLFEAFAKEYGAELNKPNNEAQAALDAAKAELEASKSKLNEAAKEISDMKRSAKLTQLLESLSGRPMEVMEAILKNTPTDKLDETYKNFIPRVLHEAARADVVEKESASAPVLAEDVTQKPAEEKTVLLNGDSPSAVVTEPVKPLTEGQRRMRTLAGIE